MDAVFVVVGVAFFVLAILVVERGFAGGKAVTAWYMVCAIIALLLLTYLFVALLKPEKF